MKLSNILIILLLIGSIIPLFLIGEVSYNISKNKLFNLEIQDMTRDISIVKNIIETYKNDILQKEQPEEKILENIATIICGPQIADSKKENSASNLRDLAKGIRIFKSGYFFIHNNSIVLIHPYGLEGSKVNVNEKIVQYRLNKKKGWQRYNWINPVTHESIDTIEVFDTVDDLNWIVVAGTHVNEFLNPVKTVKTVTYVIIFILIIIIFIYALAIVNFIFKKPIKNLIGTFQNLLSQEADLSNRLPLQGTHEFVAMSQYFNSFIEHIANIMVKVKENVENAHATGKDVDDSINNINVSITEQNDEISSVVKAIDDIYVNTNKIIKNVEESKSKTENSKNIIFDGQKILTTTAEDINKINENTLFLNDIIKKLTGSSQEIAKILDTINTIADNTNLLALNAAIEAARAGEMGRGFAVVADEIRILAQRTTDSTKEISLIINNLKIDMESANIGIEKTSVSVKAGVESVQAISDVFKNIVQMIEIIFELSLTSENSIKEQTQTIQKANMLAQKIPEITMEVNKNISSITDTIQLLLKKVDEMNNLINKFKL